MQVIVRTAICVLLGAGLGFAQSSIRVITPDTIDSVVKEELPVANGGPAVAFPIGDSTSIAAASDGSGDIYFAPEEHHRVYRVTSAGRIYLIAGTVEGYSGDGGPALLARLSNPRSLAVDRDGTVYVADGGNRAIRKISPQGVITTVTRSTAYTLAFDSSGNLYASQGNYVFKLAPGGGPTTPVAGTGATGFSGDGGPAVNATFNGVYGVAVDLAGNIFLADSGNNRIRKINSAGIVTTIAGTGASGYSGDNGPATAATFFSPRGISLDVAGNLYIADFFSHRIRRIAPNGVITTMAGASTGIGLASAGGFGGDGGPAVQATMRYPIAVAVDPAGNLYIADTNNRRIRKVDLGTGIISTYVGNGLLGAGLDASFTTISIAPTGDIYLAGFGHAVYRIRPGRTELEVFAGSVANFGFGGDGGPATMASFSGPRGLAADSAGNVYIADTGNLRIRKVSADGRISTVAAAISSVSAVAVDRDGALYFGDGPSIRKIAPDGTIRMIAGNGQSGFNDGPALGSSISFPEAIVVDASGAVIFSDGTRLRKITSDGQIRTIAGTGGVFYNGDGPSLTKTVRASGLALDSAGVLYIAESNFQRVRKLTASGNLETVAGTGQNGYEGDGGPALLARLYLPTGVAWHPSGELYVVDSLNAALRRVSFELGSSFTIANQEAASATSPGLDSTTATGYATVSDFGGGLPAGLAVVSSRSNGITVSETTIAAAPAIRAGRLLVEALGSSVNTGIAFVNPNDTAATVQFSYTNSIAALGSPGGAGNLTIAPKSQFVAYITENPFGASAPLHGTLTFSSSVPVAVTALRGLWNERSDYLATATPVTDLDALQSTAPVAIPHYTSGGGWTTLATLINPSDSQISGTIALTSPDGALVQQSGYTIGGRAAQTLPVGISGPFGIGGPGLHVGRILVTPVTGVAPTAFALLSFSQGGVTVASAAVAAVPSKLSLQFFAVNEGDFFAGVPGSVQTGVAIANTSGNPVSIEATVGPVETSLEPHKRVVFTLPVNGQRAAFLSELFPPTLLPDGPVQTVVRFQASGPISAIGLRIRLNERGEVLVSSTPTVDSRVEPAAGPLYFPFFADSTAFTTQFVLFSNGGGRASNGLLRFYSPTGELITLLR